MSQSLRYLSFWRFASLGLFLTVLAGTLLTEQTSAGANFPSSTSRSDASDALPAPIKSHVLDVEPAIIADATSGKTIIAQGTTAGRGLRVEELKGTVTINGRPAQVGDRLTAERDELVTGKNSTARLRIDSYIGVVEVAEYTTVQIQTLAGNVGIDPNQVTAIAVPEGRVRLSIARSVARPTSVRGEAESTQVAALNSVTGLGKLDDIAQESSSASASPVRVRTPAGVAGVSGTSFGVDVGPIGKTGVDTVDGVVAAEAQGTQVLVNAGFFTVIEPGKAPTTPQKTPPLADLSRFHVLKLGPRTVRVTGQVDPMDLIYINDRAIQADGDGKFQTIVPMPASRRVRIVVRGPSVRERHYNIAVP